MEKTASVVLLVNENELFRKGMRGLLEISGGVRIEEAPGTKEALNSLRRQRFDMVLMGARENKHLAFGLFEQIREFYPDLPVLIHSIFYDDLLAVRFIKAGAAGFIGRDASVKELVYAVKKVCAGGKYITDPVADCLIDAMNLRLPRSPQTMLSNREFQVFEMLASGVKNAAIAGELFLSEKTVSTYKKRILSKLACKNDIELARHAISECWIIEQ